MALNAGQATIRVGGALGAWQVLRRSRSLLLEGGVLALLFLVTLWLYRPLVVVNFNPYDRGIAAYNAVRVGSGYVPYTDMYLLYGPGGYYLRALLFALFGASIATMQFEVVALCALTIAIAYWGMRAWANRATA